MAGYIPADNPRRRTTTSSSGRPKRRATADRAHDYTENVRYGPLGAFERRPVMFAEPEDMDQPPSPQDARAGYKGYFTPSRAGTRARTRTTTRSDSDTEGSVRPSRRRRIASSSAEESSDESCNDYRNLASRGRSTRVRIVSVDPYRRGYSDDSTDDGYDPDLGGIVYSFVPSRPSPNGSTGSEISSNAHDPTAADRSLGQASSPMMRLGSPVNTEILHISASRYTGEPYLVGARSAEIKVVRETKQPRQPLFRWVHLSQKTLNFDEFSAEIMQIPSLSASELHSFERLLTQVKKDAVRPRQLKRDKTVQHMEPGSIRLTIPIDQQPRARGLMATRVLTWLCIPYFTLEEYSGLGAEVSSAGFPIETLLQHEYVRTPRARDEKYQIVRQNGYGKNGECLHISQLWCIVLDNSLLITCGRMSAPSLRGKIISLKDAEPPTEPSRKLRTIFVSYYKATMWALPLDSCLSWFSFLKHFREFWPRAIAFYDHRGNVITRNEWPRVVNEARRANTKIILDLRLRSHSLPRETGVLRGFGPGAAGAVDNTNVENKIQEGEKTSSMPARVNDTFHVFTWLGNIQSAPVSSSTGIDTELVVKQLQEIETYILSSTGTRDRSAYSRCGTSSRRAVHDYLAEHTMETEHRGDGTKRQYETRVNLYNAADLVFRFFLPWMIDSQAPTVGKFWGALYSLVEIPSTSKQTRETSRSSRKTPYSSRQVAPNIGSALRSMARYMQSFQDIFSQISADERRHVMVPDTMILAWLHLVIGIVHGSQGDLSWEEYLNVADGLVRKGMNETMQDLEAPELLDSTVVQPLDIVSLLAIQLLQDSTEGHVNLSDTYQNHLMGLKEDIDERPNRSHQLGLSRLQQEIAIIRRIIASQKRIVTTLRPALAEVTNDNSKEARILDREKRLKDLQTFKDLKEEEEIYKQKTSRFFCDKREADAEDYRGFESDVSFGRSRKLGAFSKLSPTDLGGITELLGSDSWNWLVRKDLEFHEIQLEAKRLDQQNINMIDTTKDRQEAAVFAFTMVTIVFLPLGTISSIFGMNTSDIANMELGQWVYWATALPTTGLVIVLGLWWMGELENLFSKVPGWFPSRPSGARSRYTTQNATVSVYHDGESRASLEERPSRRFRPRSPTEYPFYMSK